MTNLPYREGGNIDHRGTPAGVYLDSEAVWAEQLAKLDLPSLESREASGTRLEATP